MYDYDIIFESLQDAVDCGEINTDFAEAVNELAYERYEAYLEDGGHARKISMAKAKKGVSTAQKEKHTRNSDRVKYNKYLHSGKIDSSGTPIIDEKREIKDATNKLITSLPSKKKIIDTKGAMSDRDVSKENISARKRVLSYNDKSKMIRDAAEARKAIVYNRKPSNVAYPLAANRDIIKTANGVEVLPAKRNIELPSKSEVTALATTTKNEVDTPLKEYKRFPWINTALAASAVLAVGGVTTGIIASIKSGKINDDNVVKHVEKIAIPKLEKELDKFTTDINKKINSNDELVPPKVTKAARNAIAIKTDYINSYINELRSVNNVNDYQRVVTKYHNKEAGVIARINKNMESLNHALA